MDTETYPSAAIIEIDISATVYLTIDEVWPDGDAPEVIDAQAVKTVMESTGSTRRVLDDWMLLEGVRVKVTTVEPNPHYGGEAFGDPPPPSPFVSTTAQVWS